MPTGSPSRRNSLLAASFDPPTVSCVLAIARTCIRQAPPTFRGRGLATSAVADRLSGYTSSLSFSFSEVVMLAMMLFMAYLGVVSEADWLLDATFRQSDFVRGPRVYFGFMFCH